LLGIGKLIKKTGASMVRIEDIPEDSIVFYDIETGPPKDLPPCVKDPNFKGAISPAYARLHMKAYQLGLNGEPELAETPAENARLRDLLRDPNIIKVSYNGINFDDIVLWRYGYFVEPRGRHDLYLAMKTCAPMLPSYSLKYINELYFGDTHDAEWELWDWLKHSGNTKSMYKAPKELLATYCKHDVRQTCNVFRMIWEVIQKPMHWPTYRKLELKMAEPIHEMILLAGEWVNTEDIERRIQEIELERNELVNTAWKKYRIANLGSGRERTAVLHEKYGVEFAVSEHGNMIGRKSDWLQLMDAEDQELGPKQELAKLIYDYQDRTKVIGYLRAYLNAGRYEEHRREVLASKRTDSKIPTSNHARSIQAGRDKPRPTNGSSTNNSSKDIRIPKAYYLSGARTRRILS
jgi:hypothetical protein